MADEIANNGRPQEYRGQALPVRIFAKHSIRVLDVRGARDVSGEPIIQWDYHGGQISNSSLN